MFTITNAVKTFERGTAQENPVLRGLTLHLDAGEFVTVIGSNGAGKSTLFNVIGGTVLLDEGEIRLAGEDITFKKEFRRARDIGRLFQDPQTGTAPDFTIEENLALVEAKVARRFPLARALRREDRARFAEVTARLDMGLETRLKTRVSALSGGQRQALTLLLATLTPPKLLLLDEHTAALDPVSAKKVLGLTETIIARHRITTLMITHSISQALDLGSRTVMMHHGRIVMDLSGPERHALTPATLLERYQDTVHEALDSDRLLLG